MSVRLSVLDLAPLEPGSGAQRAFETTVSLARLADRLGFNRFWLGEHHNTRGLGSSSPEILISHVASATTRIRVGAGGMMLPNHSPLKVAEVFRTLSALYPGRIDLGIGRAPGADQKAFEALTGGRSRGEQPDYSAQLREVAGYFHDEHPEGGGRREVVATPIGVAAPPMWVLGSGTRSALLAAELGFGFAFAHHLNPTEAPAALRGYFEAFAPSTMMPRPTAVVSLSVICGESRVALERMLRTYDYVYRCSEPMEHRVHGTDSQRTKAHGMAVLRFPGEARWHGSTLVGTPGGVREELERIAVVAGVDELMIVSFQWNPEDRINTYQLLAAAFGNGS